jgi:hypothetical protein
VVAIGVATFALHLWFVHGYTGPWVFDDELGYQKLAQSIGTTGHLALFGKPGLSYSPLYPLILSPLYRLDLSGPDVYAWTKVANCVLMALSVLPIYKIARFVLPRGLSVLGAGLSCVAPLMLYSWLEMSENAAYPLFLFAFWATLVAIRSPSWQHDLLLIGTCALAAAARLQFVVLIPAAFVAAAGHASLRGRGARSVARQLARQHAVLSISTGIGALLALAAVAGTKVLSLAGQYSLQRRLPTPSAWTLVKLVADHLAGIDLALGVIPFAGTLVAAYAWRPRRSRPEINTFALVSLSVTSFLLVLTAFTAYQQSSGADLPRIHERYLFYLFPLFVISMLATTMIPRGNRMLQIGLAAGLVAGILPLVIPYHSVVNNTIAADTFGLSPFATPNSEGGIESGTNTTLIAVGFALCFGILYALARPNIVLVAVLVAGLFVAVSLTEYRLLTDAARGATAHTVPATRDWVDASGPRGGVVVLENADRNRRVDLATAETAFYNLTVSRLLYVCSPLLSPPFGEIHATLDRQGVLTDGSRPIRASYLVVPRGTGILGRVVARNVPGGLVLVEPSRGLVRIAPPHRPTWRCAGKG